MIIYIPSISIIEFEKMCCSKAQYLNTEKHVMFYSNYGIFMLKNHIFYRQTIETKTISKFDISNVEIVVDKSIVSYKKLVSQIPADCIAKIVTRKMFQLSEMTLVVVSHCDVLFDCYIETHMNETNPKVKNIINSFLFD
jgi:hypothetical protein